MLQKLQNDKHGFLALVSKHQTEGWDAASSSTARMRVQYLSSFFNVVAQSMDVVSGAWKAEVRIRRRSRSHEPSGQMAFGAELVGKALLSWTFLDPPRSRGHQGGRRQQSDLKDDYNKISERCGIVKVAAEAAAKTAARVAVQLGKAAAASCVNARRDGGFETSVRLGKTLVASTVIEYIELSRDSLSEVLDDLDSRELGIGGFKSSIKNDPRWQAVPALLLHLDAVSGVALRPGDLLKLAVGNVTVDVVSRQTPRERVLGNLASSSASGSDSNDDDDDDESRTRRKEKKQQYPIAAVLTFAAIKCKWLINLCLF